LCQIQKHQRYYTEVTRFKKGDFALLQGQLVEIIDIIIPGKNFKIARLRVKLLNTRLTNWVMEDEIDKLSSQNAPKVLFSAR